MYPTGSWEATGRARISLMYLKNGNFFEGVAENNDGMGKYSKFDGT